MSRALATHFLPRIAIDAAREHLDALSLAIDDPMPGIVEVADLLELAAIRLADFAPPIKEVDGGEA